MARPKDGRLDYFPHDVGLLQDRKFRALRREYGYLAQMIYLVVLEMAYGDKGYYLDYHDRESIQLDILDYLQGKYQPSTQDISDVIDDLVAYKLFSRDHYDRSVLTSERMQRTYYSATAERKAVTVDPNIWMLTPEQMLELSSRHSLLQFLVDRANNTDYRAGIEDSRASVTQSKGKESKEKEKERKAEESNAVSSSAAAAETAGCSAIVEAYRASISSSPAKEEMDAIRRWVGQFEPGCVLEAISQAVKYNKKSMAYIQRILERFLRDGITTADKLKTQRPHTKGKPLDDAAERDYQNQHRYTQDEFDAMYTNIFAERQP